MQPPSCPSLARFRYLPIGSPMSSYQAVKKAYFSYLAGGCRQPQNLAASETRQYRGVYPPQATSHRIQTNAPSLCAPLLFSFCSPLGSGLPPIQRSQSWWARSNALSELGSEWVLHFVALASSPPVVQRTRRPAACLPRVAEWGTKVINM